VVRGKRKAEKNVEVNPERRPTQKIAWDETKTLAAYRVIWRNLQSIVPQGGDGRI